MRALTTTDTYMQVIPEGVATILNSIESELRKSDLKGKNARRKNTRKNAKMLQRGYGPQNANIGSTLPGASNSFN